MYPVKIGILKLPHFIYNASGIWDTTVSQCLELFDTKYCGAVVTKSATLHENSGNKYPKYHFACDHYSINSNGLENKGYQYYVRSVRGTLEKPVFYSIGGFSNADRAEMIAMCSKILDPMCSAIELNMSCPNLGCVGPAYEPHLLDVALEDLFQVVGSIQVTFGLKLPPYYLIQQFEDIASVLQKHMHHIDYITCINSIPNGMDYDVDNDRPIIAPNDGYGGIGGPATLPIGLSNVSRFAKIFKERGIDIKVIGCGGISSGSDVYKYLLAGAAAVQVGTHLWKNGVTVFEEISIEFDKIMKRKGIQWI